MHLLSTKQHILEIVGQSGFGQLVFGRRKAASGPFGENDAFTLIFQELIELILDSFPHLPVIERNRLSGKGQLIRQLEGTEIEPLAFPFDFRKDHEAVFRLILAVEGIGEESGLDPILHWKRPETEHFSKQCDPVPAAPSWKSEIRTPGSALPSLNSRAHPNPHYEFPPD